MVRGIVPRPRLEWVVRGGFALHGSRPPFWTALSTADSRIRSYDMLHALSVYWIFVVLDIEDLGGDIVFSGVKESSCHTLIPQ